MGEIEGTYRVLQTPGSRLGTQTAAGVSTLELGQAPPVAAGPPGRMQTHLHMRVKLLDDTVEVFAVEVRNAICAGGMRPSGFQKSSLSAPHSILLVGIRLFTKLAKSGFGDTQ